MLTPPGHPKARRSPPRPPPSTPGAACQVLPSVHNRPDVAARRRRPTEQGGANAIITAAPSPTRKTAASHGPRWTSQHRTAAGEGHKTSDPAEERTTQNGALLDALASEGDRRGTALAGQREGAGRSQSQTGREGFAIQRWRATR